MIIIIWLIHWYTSINSFHQLCNFEFEVCTINMMKSRGHMKFENMSKWQVEITFKKTKCYSWKLDDHYYHVNPLIHLCNSFHQLSYFVFAVYFEWDEKLRTYEIGNESKWQVEITFKQSIMYSWKLDDHYYHVNTVFTLMLIAFTNFRTFNLQFTLNEMKSWGHMK